MKESRCSDFDPTFDETNSCKYYAAQHDGKVCGFCKKADRYRCINDLGYKPLPLSHSGVQSFLTCHHLFYLQQVLGITTRNQHVSRPMKMGMLWDAVMQYALGDKTMVDLQSKIEEYDVDEVEVQKVKALYKAWKELGIKVEDGYELQAKIDLQVEFEEKECWGTGEPVELHVRGFYDRKYPTYFVENKMSGRPDNYLDLFFIQSQVGTYFLADPRLESVVMEIVRTPDLRMTRKEEDSPETYGNRTYHDILSRPAHYFIGWSSEKNTYGKKFYRNEFELTELLGRYKHIFREIHEAAMLEGWFRNDRACKNVLPGIACDMLGVCRYGKISDEVYTIKDKTY
jgi:hypothetical protein